MARILGPSDKADAFRYRASLAEGKFTGITMNRALARGFRCFLPEPEVAAG